ncbi:MAG: NAD-dependent epimerase/dehydratase family protein, partial [Chloroflexi bacterium]|nr:NAD-dependent epimerase/dehydratase family protein [Chloroflexota bacterium]
MAIVLVTGANGFIGSHLVRELLARGHTVRGLVRHTSDLSSLTGLPIALFIGDVRERETLAAPMHGVEYVYHLAAALLVSSQAEFEATNTRGTQHMLEAAEKYAAGTLKRFLYVSSQAAAGPSQSTTPLNETAELKPVSWYGTSKKLAEEIIGTFAGRLPITIVRPSAVYGERERDISQAFAPIRQHVQPKIGLTEKHTVMVYAADLVQGFIAAAESDQSIGQAYHLTHPKVLTTGEVIKTIAAAADAPIGVMLPVPIGLLALAAPVAEFIAQFNRQRPPVTRDKVRELSEHFWVTDPSRAKRDFGWEAQHDLLSGMRLTTHHFYEEQAQLRAMP